MELAREMEVQAKQQAVNNKLKLSLVGRVVDSQLWTEKYAPTTMKDIIGNKGLVEKLQRWLRDWFVVACIVLIFQAEESQVEFQEAWTGWNGTISCCYYFWTTGNWEDNFSSSRFQVGGL